MKEEHLKKVEARAARARQLLLPEAVSRGEVADPKDRLRELLKRVGGREERDWPENFPLRTAVTDLETFLGTDMAELTQAVRDAQADARKARQELSARAGTRYTLTITSDAPLAVASREVVPPPEEPPGPTGVWSPHYGRPVRPM